MPWFALAGSCLLERWAWQVLMFEGVNRPLLLVVLRDSVIERESAVSQRASAERCASEPIRVAGVVLVGSNARRLGICGPRGPVLVGVACKNAQSDPRLACGIGLATSQAGVRVRSRVAAPS